MTAARKDYGFEALKERQRAIREGFPSAFGLRIHRTISWIGRAEEAGEDDDAAFIFLWIAFNAAYSDGRDLDGGRPASERSRFADFFGKIVEQDFDHLIYRAVWDRFAGPIRGLIESPYLFSPFWAFQHGEAAEDWRGRFASAGARFERALGEGDTGLVLSFLFDRLYMLRNQLIHGGATWGSSVNRGQLGDGVEILGCIVPVMADIMMTYPEADWGRPFFPVVAQP